MFPSALGHAHEIAGRGDQLAVFLDYDGTLTPIVSRPDRAVLMDSTRAILRTLEAREFLPALDSAEKELREKLTGIAGALIERKCFSIAAHYRKVNERDFPKLERGVSEIAARHRELRKIDGKKVYELLPKIDWDKGKAVLWLLEKLGLEHPNTRPIYIGDDRTDEDAFRALEQRGVGILVSEEPRVTAASYSLRDPSEVERFLSELIATLT